MIYPLGEGTNQANQGEARELLPYFLLRRQFSERTQLVPYFSIQPIADCRLRATTFLANNCWLPTIEIAFSIALFFIIGSPIDYMIQIGKPFVHRCSYFLIAFYRKTIESILDFGGYKMSFSDRLNIAMQNAGYTQGALAKAVGMAQSSINQLLNKASGSRKL